MRGTAAGLALAIVGIGVSVTPIQLPYIGPLLVIIGCAILVAELLTRTSLAVHLPWRHREPSSPSLAPVKPGPTPDVADLRIWPEFTDGWLHLHIRNDGPTKVCSVLVEEIEGSGQIEQPYHAPWRGSGVQDRRLAQGDIGLMNLCEIVPPGVNELMRDTRNVRFYSAESSQGFFVRTLPLGARVALSLLILTDHEPIHEGVMLEVRDR